MCRFRVLGNTGSSTCAYAVRRGGASGRGQAVWVWLGSARWGGGERERKEKVTSQ